MALTEHIQSLPPELREKILKEHTALKLREKKEAGWDKIHHVIQTAFSHDLDPTGDCKICYCNHCLHLKYGIAVIYGVEKEGEEPTWACLPCDDVFEYLKPELFDYAIVAPQFFDNPFIHLKKCKYKKRHGKNGPIECPCLGSDRKRLETAWVEDHS